YLLFYVTTVNLVKIIYKAVQFRDSFFHACGLPFFVKKELYHRHHHLVTLVSTIYLCNPYPELGYFSR
ncbi:MAG: hypothetical protein LN545_05435, partial [Candidatus Megaira endosymbiont of Carteria cerasiformis]